MKNKIKLFPIGNGECLEIKIYPTQIDSDRNNLRSFCKGLNKRNINPKVSSKKFVSGMNSVYQTEYFSLKNDVMKFISICNVRELNVKPEQILELFYITQAKLLDIITDLNNEGLL